MVNYYCHSNNWISQCFKLLLWPLNSYACYFLLIFRNILKSNLFFTWTAMQFQNTFSFFGWKIPRPSMKTSGLRWLLSHPLCSVALWTLSLHFYPKSSPFFYACSDTDPVRDWQLKNIMLFQIEVAITAVIQLTIYFKIKLF